MSRIYLALFMLLLSSSAFPNNHDEAYNDKLGWLLYSDNRVSIYSKDYDKSSNSCKLKKLTKSVEGPAYQAKYKKWKADREDYYTRQADMMPALLEAQERAVAEAKARGEDFSGQMLAKGEVTTKLVNELGEEPGPEPSNKQEFLTREVTVYINKAGLNAGIIEPIGGKSHDYNPDNYALTQAEQNNLLQTYLPKIQENCPQLQQVQIKYQFDNKQTANTQAELSALDVELYQDDGKWKIDETRSRPVFIASKQSIKGQLRYDGQILSDEAEKHLYDQIYQDFYELYSTPTATVFGDKRFFIRKGKQTICNPHQNPYVIIIPKQHSLTENPFSQPITSYNRSPFDLKKLQALLGEPIQNMCGTKPQITIDLAYNGMYEKGKNDKFDSQGLYIGDNIYTSPIIYARATLHIINGNFHLPHDNENVGLTFVHYKSPLSTINNEHAYFAKRVFDIKKARPWLYQSFSGLTRSEQNVVLRKRIIEESHVYFDGKKGSTIQNDFDTKWIRRMFDGDFDAARAEVGTEYRDRMMVNFYRVFSDVCKTVPPGAIEDGFVIRTTVSEYIDFNTEFIKEGTPIKVSWKYWSEHSDAYRQARRGTSKDPDKQYWGFLDEFIRESKCSYKQGSPTRQFADNMSRFILNQPSLQEELYRKQAKQ